MKENILTLTKVKECFILYNQAFNRFAYVDELAKELGVKTTELMKFIVDNKDHFALQVNKRGTSVLEVYVDLKYKIGTEEWLAYQKEIYKDTIFLSKAYKSYVLSVDFHFVEESSKDVLMSNEWKNTKEKMEKIKSYLNEATTWVGIYATQKTYDNCLLKENIELLIYQGWKFENYDKNCAR